MSSKLLYGSFLLALFTVECRMKFEFETFGHCLKQKDNPNIIKCAGEQALETLQQFNNIENFTLAKGVTISRDDSAMGRNIPTNFLDDSDPSDIRSLLENAGIVMSHRSLQYDMSRLYPGLQLRVGPTVNGGLMEFVVDPSTQYDERSHLLHEESTARVVTKKFLLPFLLGLKFNLATLLPLILGAIILISKKAAFLSKIALFISGMFGLGGIYSLGALGTGSLGGGFGGGLGGGYPHGFAGYPPVLHDPGIHHQHQFTSPYKVLDNNTPRSEEPQPDHFYDYDKQHLKDRASRVHERDFDFDKKSTAAKYRTQRNFVWQTAD